MKYLALPVAGAAVLAGCVVATPTQAANAAIKMYYYELGHLSSSGTKLCLTSTGKNAAVVLKTCSNASTQKWFSVSYGSEYVLTNLASVSKTSTTYVLTASSQSAGATFTMRGVTGRSEQQWRYDLSAANDGFVNNVSSRVITAGSLASGAGIKVAAKQDGGYLQGWRDYGAGTYS